MEINDLLAIAVAVVLAVAGWIVAHKTTSKRDLRSRMIELRTKYLIDLYHQLYINDGRAVTARTLCNIEDTLCYIQLFSSRPKDIERILSIAQDFGGDLKTLRTARLQQELRDSLRKELGLKAYKGSMVHTILSLNGKDSRELVSS